MIKFTVLQQREFADSNICLRMAQSKIATFHWRYELIYVYSTTNNFVFYI